MEKKNDILGVFITPVCINYGLHRYPRIINIPSWNIIIMVFKNIIMQPLKKHKYHR
jgi:hypothetical protein